MIKKKKKYKGSPTMRAYWRECQKRHRAKVKKQAAEKNDCGEHGVVPAEGIARVDG